MSEKVSENNLENTNDALYVNLLNFGSDSDEEKNVVVKSSMPREDTLDKSTNIVTCDSQRHVTNEKMYEIEVIPASPEEICMKHRTEYRDSDSWTEDESDSSSSSDSEISFEDIRSRSPTKVTVAKTKGELDIEDLPPIEYLKISVDERELQKMGRIHGVVKKLVVIKAIKDQKPLDMGSVLFLGPDKPLGRVLETLGPVSEPFYTVMFNKNEDIIENGITEGDYVYFAPDKTEMTAYVFVDALRQQKGSDASWMDNNEPPEEHLDYSDDEQERAAKKKRKGKGQLWDDADEDEVQIVPSAEVSTSQKKSTGSLYDSNTNVSSYNQDRKTFKGLRQANFSYSSGNFSNHSSSGSERYSGKSNFSERESPRNNNSSNDVWISAQPPNLDQKPMSLFTSNSNTSRQYFSAPHSRPQQFRSQSLNNQQNQSRQGSFLHNNKQPFAPRHPPSHLQSTGNFGNINNNLHSISQAPHSDNMNYNSQPLSEASSGSMNYYPQSVSPMPPSRNINYNSQPVPQASPSGSINYNPQPSSGNWNYNPPPRPQASPSGNINYNPQPVPQMSSSGNWNYNPRASPSGSINYNPQPVPNSSNQQQHIFGQITPVGLMSPAPPISPMIYCPPSPSIYVPPDQTIYTPIPSPVSFPSPNPFWPSRDVKTPPFPNLQSPPPNMPLHIQIPNFSSETPVASFSIPDLSMPPPNNFSTSTHQTTSRF